MRERDPELDAVWDLWAKADADARAVPYLMDMIAHLQGQVAALTGPDDPALDIEGHKVTIEEATPEGIASLLRNHPTAPKQPHPPGVPGARCGVPHKAGSGRTPGQRRSK